MDGLEEEIINELKDEFYDDLKNRLQVINKNIVYIEKKDFDEKILKDTYRILHNIKGTSATLFLNEISRVAHKLEGIVALLLKDKNHNRSIFSDIFGLCDVIDELRLAYAKKEGEAEISRIVEKAFAHKKKKLALIIEYSNSIRKFIKKAFIERNYDVIEQKDALSGLLISLIQPVDLIITSNEHKNITGLNMIKMLKILPKKKDIKTILLTSKKISDEGPDTIIIKDDMLFENIKKSI